MAQPTVKEAPFRLTNLEPIIVASGSANGVAARWSDIWKYQVPVGVALIIRPEHSFSAYLADVGAEANDATCAVKIEKRDPSSSDVITLYGPDLYKASKEFQDDELKARMKVPLEGVVVEQRQLLVISALYANVILVASSYFELHISKVRKTLQV